MDRLVKMSIGGVTRVVDLLRNHSFTGYASADFPAAMYRRGGARLNQSDVLTLTSAPSATGSGGIAVSRATANVFAGNDMAGAVVGVRGSGGALPTGWIAANAGIAIEILAFDSTGITLRFTRGTNTESGFGVRNVNPGTGGQAYPVASRGGVATTATIEVLDATSNITGVTFSVSRLSGTTTVATTSAMGVRRGDPPRRLTIWESAADIAGMNASVRFGGLVGGANPTSDPYSLTVRLSDLMMEDSAGPADVTPYTASSRPAQTLSLLVSDGDYDVLAIGSGDANGPDGGIWLSGTATGGVLTLPTRSGATGDAMPVDTRIVHAFPAGLSRARKEACHQVIDRARLLRNPGDNVRVARGGIEYAVQNSMTAYTWQPAWNRRNYDRFEVRGSDHWDAGSGAGPDPVNNRSEFSGHALRLPFDTDVWIAYWHMLEPGDPQPEDYWCLMGQIHASEDAGDAFLSPVWAFTLLPGDEVRIVTRSDPAPVNTVNPDSVIRGSVPRYRRGVWHSWVHRVRFCRTGSTGAAQSWLDGAEVMNVEGIPVGYNDAVGPYWKYGIYRRTVEITTGVRYANVEAGTASLIDRVANPRPIA